jgi:hypothetical protein
MTQLASNDEFGGDINNAVRVASIGGTSTAILQIKTGENWVAVPDGALDGADPAATAIAINAPRGAVFRFVITGINKVFVS